MGAGSSGALALEARLLGAGLVQRGPSQRISLMVPPSPQAHLLGEQSPGTGRLRVSCGENGPRGTRPLDPWQTSLGKEATW